MTGGRISLRDRFGLRHSRYLLLALYCGILATMGRAYFPATPDVAHTLDLVFLFTAVVFVVLAWRRPLRAATSRWGRWARWAVFLPALVCLVQMHGLSYMVAYGVAPLLGLSLCFTEVAVLGWAFYEHRRDRTRPRGQVVFGTAVFAGAVLYWWLCLWMWWPPAPERCAAAAGADGVRLLTPADLPQRLSYPYDLLYLDDRKLVVASFKMAGNLTLGFWDDPTANLMVSVPVGGDGDRRADVLPLYGPTLPEYLLYDPPRGRILFTRLGYGDSYIGELALTADGRLEHVRDVPIDFEPHTLFSLPEGHGFVAVGVEKDVITFTDDIRPAPRRWRLDVGREVWEPLGLVVVHGWQSPGASTIYLSFVGVAVLEVDLQSHAMRAAAVPLGGGQAAVDDAHDLIFQSDYLGRGINVIDRQRMAMVGRFDLPFTPRPLWVDGERMLVIVSDWFGGWLHVYRYRLEDPASLVEVGAPVDVGPYIRELAYDEAGGRVFAASKCGVYEVDLAAATGGFP